MDYQIITTLAQDVGGQAPGWILPVQNILYVVAAILFIFGIKGLTHPRTAVQGNLKALAGMLLAMLATLLMYTGDLNVWDGWYLWVLGIIIGSAVGLIAAKLVQMTAMPEMVALYNGSGGAASMLVAGAVFMHFASVAAGKAGGGEVTAELIGEAIRAENADPMQTYIATAASGIIGAVTASGSFLAFLKLRGKFGNASTNPMLKVLNGVFFVISVIFGVWLVLSPETTWLYWAVAGSALICGVFFVMPIGGADMPVVISLLNSFSGLAACATGFVISNTVLIVSGSLVGASGLILTQIMCVAMNRS
ncbi:MAG: NAD(P)(+) transhydrogenase (Re/Si-specific) subunit beta, partial [Phycisphaerales bacterium]